MGRLAAWDERLLSSQAVRAPVAFARRAPVLSALSALVCFVLSFVAGVVSDGTLLLGVAGLILSLAGALIWLVLVRAAVTELNDRGQPGWVIAVTMLLVPPLGFLAWMVRRKHATPG